MAGEPFSIQNACEALKIGEEIYLRILKRALEQTDQDIEDLKTFYENKDTSGIAAIAHRLKGDYANLRVDHLAAISKELNDLAKGEYDQDRAGTLIKNFLEQYVQVKEFIRTKS